MFLFSGSDQVVSFMKSYEKDGKVEIPLSLREKVNYAEGSPPVCRGFKIAASCQLCSWLYGVIYICFLLHVYVYFT